MLGCARFLYSWCFNTQPHGGGCFVEVNDFSDEHVSTHSRTEAAAMVGTSMMM